jgi:CheY-like chemotaxis protein
MARILVIDDDVMVRDMLKTVLEAAGHKVVEAPNGISGVNLYRSHPVDLVITDILMPEADGSVAIRLLKRDFPDVKIIAMSGGGEIVGSETCLSVAQRAGASMVFEKPVGHDELLKAVRDLVGQ